VKKRYALGTSTKMRVTHHIYYNFSQNKVIGPELFGNPELPR
jgi:hypothetical protein